MNDNYFTPDKPKPTETDERPDYRFQDYENFAGNYVPTASQQNPPFMGNRNSHIVQSADEKHLDQLSLGFKIYAGINALFSSFPIIHLILGIMMVTGGMDDGKNAPPQFFGWFFIIFALVFIIFGYSVSACSFYAGKFLKERSNYTFCFVMSCINCAFMPLGTVLGVFGIIVLLRDSVKNLFQEKA